MECSRIEGHHCIAPAVVRSRLQFADRVNHINGIENFWNQAKRHLRRYNGIPRAHFPLYLKECEWRFNYRPANRLLATLKTWLNETRSIPI
jgi:transposase